MCCNCVHLFFPATLPVDPRCLHFWAHISQRRKETLDLGCQVQILTLLLYRPGILGKMYLPDDKDSIWIFT